MNQISIRLIENKIATSAEIVTALCQQLTDYKLSVARDISEAINEPESADVILLNVSQLSGGIDHRLGSLASAYHNVPIILLVPPAASPGINEDTLLEALACGADDYVALSPAGLLALTKRLSNLRQIRIDQGPVQPVTFPNLVCEAVNADNSQLAIQILGTDFRVRAWNKASAILFGLDQSQALNQLVDDLPLTPGQISRFKDILDQVQATNEPFFIPLYPLESQHAEVSWVHIHVYPIYQELQRLNSEPVSDVCIVVTPVPDTPDPDSDSIHLKHDLQLLLEANREISGQLELTPTLEKVGEQVKSLLHSDNCQIYFLEKDNQTLRPVYTSGPLAGQIKAISFAVGQGLVGEIAATGKPIKANKGNNETVMPHPFGEHLLGCPLTSLGGAIGLIIVSRSEKPYAADDLHFFENLAQQASVAINNARLFEETQRSLNELAILYEASTVISSHWDDQGVLNTLIRQMVSAIDVSRGFISKWDEEQNRGKIQAVYSIDDTVPEIDNETTLNPSERTPLLTLVNQRRPLFFHLSNPSLDEIERREMEKYGCLSRLLMPLVAKGSTIGWIELWETRRERSFTADEVRLSRALSSQIAIALQNNHYLEQTQRTLEETTALFRVASALTTPQDPQAIISTVLREYLQVLGLNQGSVVIFDFVEKCGDVKSRIQENNPAIGGSVDAVNKPGYQVLEGRQIPLQNNPVYERLMRTHQAVIINDPKADWLTSVPSFVKRELPPAGGWGDENVLAMLIIPIKIRGEIVGTVVAENTQYDRPFTQWDASTGQAMADQLGVGLQNVELYEAEYRRREQAETLREVTAIVSSSLNPNEVLERVLDQLGRVVRYDSAAIHIIEGARRRVIAGRGFAQLEDHIGLTYPVKIDEDEPGSIAINKRQPLVFGDISGVYPSFKQEIHSHIRSWMGVPLIARDRVIGLISIDHSESNTYQEEDLQMALAFANQVAITLENARLHEIEVRELGRELEIAQEIQTTLLPQSFPQVPGLDIAGQTLPARQVGGDFFHFFSTDPDELGVAIGDVSGKGIPAALYMAAGITAIDTQTGPDVMPGELLNILNKKLYNRLKENRMNIALQVATFIPLPNEGRKIGDDKKASGSLMTAASAGMIAPIGATEHGCRFLPIGGLPIGALPAAQNVYTDDVFLLDPFTTIIFTSDGIVEAMNEYGELFGFERLEATVLEIVGSRNAQVITDYIINAAKEFTGSAEQHDDMTVVVVVKQ